jgi:CBS-domain-containing membrane protein
VVAGIVCLAVGGFSYAPFGATSMALFQSSVSTARLPEVLAGRGVATMLCVPAGTLFASALAAIGLGLIAAAAVRRRPRRLDHTAPGAGPRDEVPSAG